MQEPRISTLGLCDYAQIEQAMQQQVETRDAESADELWLLEHPGVITLGVRADPGHIHSCATLPIHRTRRGGAVTCHVPGQLVVYLLLDLHRLGLGVRALVERLEQATVDLLEEAGLSSMRRPEMPGVYVDGGKIASVGLRVSHGCSSHGLALNVNPDLEAFRQINLCGDPGLEATSLAACGVSWDVKETGGRLSAHLLQQLYGKEAA